MRNILLLSATIQPKSDQPQLAIVNHQERLGEYRKALAFYAAALERGTIDAIVFAENSSFDLSSLRRDFPHPAIDWVSTWGLDYDPSFHRGYGEFQLLDHAHQVSQVLQNAAPEDKVWKVTGRYILKNLKTVVATQPKVWTVYCDTRDGWSEMSVMGWTVPGFERFFRPFWPRFATGKAPELLLAEEMPRWVAQDPQVVTRYHWPPYLIGRRGTNGQSYQGRLGLLRHTAKIVPHLLGHH